MTKIEITPANVADLVKLQDGDMAVLVGEFAPFTLKRKTWSTGVVLDAAKAVLTGWLFQDVEGVTLRGAALKPSGAWCFIAEACRRITWDGVTCEGNGVKGVGGAELAVLGSLISRHAAGVSMTQVRDVTVADTTFRYAKSDGVQIAGCGGKVLITRNTFDGTERPGAEHPDFVQFWPLPGSPIEDIEISDNVGVGDSQGFGAYDGAKGQVKRVLIKGNRLNIGFAWAVYLSNVDEAILEDNAFNGLSRAAQRDPVAIGWKGVNDKAAPTGTLIYRGRNIRNGVEIPPTELVIAKAGDVGAVGTLVLDGKSYRLVPIIAG